MTTKTLSFKSLPNLAIAEGATTPNPGQTGVWAWSTTLAKPVFWNGTSWSAGATGVGSGDVVGPASSVNNNFPTFSGTTGKLLKASTLTSLDSASLSGTQITAPTTLHNIVSRITNTAGAYSLNHTLTYDDGAGIVKGVGMTINPTTEAPSIGLYYNSLGLFFNFNSTNGEATISNSGGVLFFKNSDTAATTLSIGALGQLRIGNSNNAGTSGQVFTSGGAGAPPTWSSLKTVNGNSLLGTGDIVISGGAGSGDVVGPAVTTDGHLPVFSGTTGKIIKEATFFDVPAIGIPAAPAAGDLRWFARNRAGRLLPHIIGPAGIDVALQPALFGNSIYMWSPSTGTTVSTNFGTSWTARNAGTGAAQAHPTRASTNALTSLNRATFTTGTTATGSSGVSSALQVAWIGNAANLGGFYATWRFGVETTAADLRVMCALSALNAALAGEPSAQANTVGLCKDSTDSTWQIVTRNATTVTKTPTGATVTAGQVLDFTMFCPPNGTSITFRLVDAVTGTVLVDNVVVSTNLPVNTTFLYAHAQIMSVTGTTGKVLALNRIYVETDL